MCNHTETIRKNERPFFGSVANEPYTDENPSAHGNITYTEVCVHCGAERQVNSNVGIEVSPWGPNSATRKVWDNRNKKKKHAEDVKKIRDLGFSIKSCDGVIAQTMTPEGPKSVPLADMLAASRLPQSLTLPEEVIEDMETPEEKEARRIYGVLATEAERLATA